MVKETKFRAWDKEYAHMIYSDSGSDEYVWRIDGNCVTVIWIDSQEGIKHSKEVECEVMRYIGLHDKSGKDIYEGDICKRKLDDKKRYKNSENWCDYWLIEWLPRTAGFVTTMIAKYDTFSKKMQDVSRCANSYSQRFNEMDEVIGNIYEHPEFQTSQS